jgi:uncharacterized coiled-coil protein SlyX
MNEPTNQAERDELWVRIAALELAVASHRKSLQQITRILQEQNELILKLAEILGPHL